VSQETANRPLTRYETLLITLPEIQKEELESFLDRSGQSLTKFGGNLIKTTEWGRRRLSYEIKKQNEGLYYLLEYDGQDDCVAKFQEFLRLQSECLRYMTTRKDPRVESVISQGD